MIPIMYLCLGVQSEDRKPLKVLGFCVEESQTFLSDG